MNLPPLHGGYRPASDGRKPPTNISTPPSGSGGGSPSHIPDQRKVAFPMTNAVVPLLGGGHVEVMYGELSVVVVVHKPYNAVGMLALDPDHARDFARAVFDAADQVRERHPFEPGLESL